MRPPLDLRDCSYIAVPLIVSAIAGMASELSPYPVRTDLVHALEGGTVALFQPLVDPAITTLFVATYLLAYPALLLWTYVAVKRQQGRSRALDYVVTYTTTIVVSIPFFYFVPVGVTGYFLDGVQPVLYESTGPIQAFMLNVDTLQKALPSLHAGLAASASLHAPRGYERASWTVTGVVLASTLYLGIHWLTDLALGLGLAYASYRLTPSIRAALARAGAGHEPAPASGD
ncbi:phosphatase PAP2 family protein [Halorubellus sp. PRR65]|uniref:phosphatase PAP2 family protein n=1 Tax=Halorubellus sp. PRR65 TaxID=3098148 RepID=UPI002B262E78|nr:phosphatase PAP2 family protein [Halorubellus sp. PRR65]